MDRTGPDATQMPRLNIITGCVLILAGLVVIFWVIPYHIEPQKVDRYVNSPKFFSYVCAIVLTVLAVLLVFQNIYRIIRRRELSQEESEENETLGFGWHETINLGNFIIGSAAYLFLMNTAGFVVSSILLLAVSMYFARVKLLWLVITSVGIPIFIQQLLWHAMMVRLP
jgi:hypothetical protein